jgi:protein TonB
MSDAPPAPKPPPRPATRFFALLRLVFATLGGLLLTVFIFGVLPYLQIVAGGGVKDRVVRQVAAISAPPPQDSLLEEPPPPPDAEEEPPPEMQQPMNLSLSDISASLNPGGGSGATILNNAIGGGAMQAAMNSFSMGEIDQKPRAVYQEQPRLPATLRRGNVTGRVEVEFTVDVQGRVQNPRVTSSSNPALNEPVIAAIKKWRFDPGTRGGKKVPFKIKMPFRFGG